MAKTEDFNVYGIFDEEKDKLLMICSSEKKAHDIIIENQAFYDNWGVRPIGVDVIPKWILNHNGFEKK